MNSEAAKVRSWLEEVLGGEVPAFELTPEALEILTELSHLSRERDSQLQVLGDLMKRQAAEYTAEADRMLQGLAAVGVAPEQVLRVPEIHLAATTACSSSPDLVARSHR